MNDLIDFLVIHQGIIDSHDTMFSKGIVIALIGPDIVSISKALEKIVKDVRAGGDDHIHQLHLDHISDHPAHPTRDHCPGQTHKDNALRVLEHFQENFKTLKNVSALKRGALEGFDQVEKAFGFLEI
jgi:hypothetical protein